MVGQRRGVRRTIGEDTIAADVSRAGHNSAAAAPILGGRDDDVIVGGDGRDVIKGRDGDDKLDGSGGDDLIIGGAGNDRIFGGDGVDTVSFKDASAGVVLDLDPGRPASAAIGGSEVDTLDGVENVLGSRFADTLTLRGSVGRLSGGGGDDRVYLDPATVLGERPTIRLRGGDGYDTLDLTLRTAQSAPNIYRDVYLGRVITGFEEVRGSEQNDSVVANGDTGSIKIYGAGGNDSLHAGEYWNSAGSFLFGEAGDDYLSGGTDTVYYGGDGDDTISLSYPTRAGFAVVDGGSGIDRLFLPDNGDGGKIVLRDHGSGTFITAVGSSGSIEGIENIYASSFDDRVIGNSADNSIVGGYGADIIDGGAGNDIIFGDFQNADDGDVDTLTGGAGADQFAFKFVPFSYHREIADRILDFSHADGDRINLAEIDADTSTPGNQTFAFIADQAFNSQAGELRYDSHNGITLVEADVDGDARADLTIRLTGELDLRIEDFVL